MPTPPKDPAERKRRNKASTADELEHPDDVPAGGLVKAPPLNAQRLGLKRGSVHPNVREWWADAWASPMAARWLKADYHVMYLIAQLRQQLQTFLLDGKPITTLAAEIAKQEARLGLDVMARRRLDWRMAPPRDPDRPLSKPDADEAQAPPPPRDGVDTRAVLRAMK